MHRIGSMRRQLWAIGAAVAIGAGSLAGAGLVRASSDHEALATDLAVMFRSARKVISVNQGLINDKTKGDKGLTGAHVVAETRQNYASATGHPLELGSGLEAQLKQAMLDSVDEVMGNAQTLINRQGMGFKGFLPAVFAKQVADAFGKRASGAASIKLTAPTEYVRNRANWPDEWETAMIDGKFKSAGYPKGQAFAEQTSHGGKPAYRLIIPEYYSESCLGCHGEPKGERDVTGGKKEGGKAGELGGAISVSIFGDSAPASAH